MAGLAQHRSPKHGRQSAPAAEAGFVVVPDPALRGGLQGRGQAADQKEALPKGDILPGEQLQGQLPPLPQPQIGRRVQLVGDDGGLILPFLPGGGPGRGQGVGRGTAETEAVLRQIAELPVKAGVFPADPAQGPVAEVPLDVAKPVCVQKDADAASILTEQGLIRSFGRPMTAPTGRHDPRPHPVPVGAGQGLIEGQGLLVGDDLPAGPAAAVGAGPRGAGEGPEYAWS